MEEFRAVEQRPGKVLRVHAPSIASTRWVYNLQILFQREPGENRQVQFFGDFTQAFAVGGSQQRPNLRAVLDLSEDVARIQQV
jgi:hypothetical protein